MNSQSPNGYNYFNSDNVRGGEFNSLSGIDNQSIGQTHSLPIISDQRFTFNYNYFNLNPTFYTQNNPGLQYINQTPTFNIANYPEYSPLQPLEFSVTSNYSPPNIGIPSYPFDPHHLPSSFHLNNKLIAPCNVATENTKPAKTKTRSKSKSKSIRLFEQSTERNCNNNNNQNNTTDSNLDLTPKYKMKTKYKFSKQLIEYFKLNASDYFEPQTVIIFFPTSDEALALCAHIRTHRPSYLTNATVKDKNLAFTVVDKSSSTFCVVTDENCFCSNNAKCIAYLDGKEPSELPEGAVPQQIQKLISDRRQKRNLQSGDDLLSHYVPKKNNTNESQSSMRGEPISCPPLIQDKTMFCDENKLLEGKPIEKQRLEAIQALLGLNTNIVSNLDFFSNKKFDFSRQLSEITSSPYPYNNVIIIFFPSSEELRKNQFYGHLKVHSANSNAPSKYICKDKEDKIFYVVMIDGHVMTENCKVCKRDYNWLNEKAHQFPNNYLASFTQLVPFSFWRKVAKKFRKEKSEIAGVENISENSTVNNSGQTNNIDQSTASSNKPTVPLENQQQFIETNNTNYSKSTDSQNRREEDLKESQRPTKKKSRTNSCNNRFSNLTNTQDANSSNSSSTTDSSFQNSIYTFLPRPSASEFLMRSQAQVNSIDTSSTPSCEKH